MNKVFMAVLALSIMAMPSIADARKGRKASAPRPAATAPAKQAVPQQQATQAAATNTAPQAAPARNGMMGNIMSTAAGVAIGSVVADSLTNDATAEEAPAAAEAPETIEPAAQ